MIRWYFEELGQLPLSPSERVVATEVERHLLNLMVRLYRTAEPNQRAVII